MHWESLDKGMRHDERVEVFVVVVVAVDSPCSSFLDIHNIIWDRSFTDKKAKGGLSERSFTEERKERKLSHMTQQRIMSSTTTIDNTIWIVTGSIDDA